MDNDLKNKIKALVLISEMTNSVIIHFDGFDMHKDFLYIMHAESFLKRGIALLIVDHPGVGEALRLRGIPSGHNTELPAKASFDFIETRSDVLHDRVGIIARERPVRFRLHGHHPQRGGPGGEAADATLDHHRRQRPDRRGPWQGRSRRTALPEAG